MASDNAFYVFHATATNFDGVRLKILLRVDDLGKWVSIRRKNSLPTFDFTFLLNGGLNQMIFLPLFLFVLPEDFVVG